MKPPIIRKLCCTTLAVLSVYSSFSFADTTLLKRNHFTSWNITLPTQVQKGMMTEIIVNMKNISSKEWTGYLALEFFKGKIQDNDNVDGLMSNIFPNQYFTLEYKGNCTLKFPFTIPLNFTDTLYYKIKMFDRTVIDSIQSFIRFKN